MECNLSSSTFPWTCIVTLRFTKSIKGETLGEPLTIQFGPPITSKAAVEERIRRAQRAILNPSTDFKQFLNGDDEDPSKSEIRFSSNCVSLQISGEGVANLSFCDLPGLIASATGGNSGDIDLVKGLVASYISKPSCIILLTVACESDFEIQGAHGLVKEYDPEGKRTIGVLTKPDRIPHGDESRWLSFIRNKEEPLQHGWFCVKQPSSKELKEGITWAEARQKENEFFSMTSPWSDLEPMYQKHLRTSNLIERASAVLSNLISERLPKIQEELQRLLDETKEALDALPREPSSDPLAEIIRLLYDFTRDVTRHVEGIPSEKGLLQVLRPHQEYFRSSIRTTAPDFRVHSRGAEVYDDGITERPSFLRDEEDDLAASALAAYAGSSPNNVVYIDEVLERAYTARTRELPDNYPFVVRASFINEITREWRKPAKNLCDMVYKILSDFIKGLIQDHFSAFGQGQLEQRVRVIVQDHLQQCRVATEAKIDWLLRLEDRPFTLNTHYLAAYKDKFLSYYKAARQRENNATLEETIRQFKPSTSQQVFNQRTGRMEGPEVTGIAKVLAGLAEIGITGVKPEDLPKLLPPDAMEPALNIMAEVRAYFQVAYKRFADNVPLTIDRELIFGLDTGLVEILQARLGITGPHGQRICQELVEERPAVAEQRKDLKKKLERLNAAWRELLA
ncbi:hypothetical protein HGRIS_001798 [Hohenbuehelia grisea]|uniref:GED domain-containing protein n=1 Tax=Hohenbuehelia grisea TaxID=104357 RepID=A0ABR3JII5_9AGAR